MIAIQFNSQAIDDLEQAFAYYFDVANLSTAERFRDAVDDALTHIARHPDTGSPRYGLAIGSRSLRFWTLNHFPYAVFYQTHPKHIDIVRVLHQSRDIPKHLQAQ